MIKISGATIDTLPLQEGFTPNALQKEIFETLLKSSEVYRYDNANQLIFEFKLRNSIVDAARDLSRSNFSFKVFRKSMCNADYWQRTDEGGFQLESGIKPYDAIRDIYQHSSLYGTECSTAMIIVYYKALLDVLPEELFNKLFPDIYLMNWQHIDRDLAIADFSKVADELPGDARYFKNPDVDPMTPEWQGENVFFLGNGKYYGHGIGIANAETIIKALNGARVAESTKTAYLMDSVKRPNFKYLAGKLENFKRI